VRTFSSLIRSALPQVLRAVLCLLLSFSFEQTSFTASAHQPGPAVPLCSRRIAFTASYLVQTEPGKGPGYLFRIDNGTPKPITLVEPVPSSAHWYAKVGNRWLWRASSGAGGSYVDAINEKGPVFAYQPKDAPADPSYLTVPANGHYEWTASEREIPALAYKPGCARCNYPGEHDYMAVFAYAYLPPRQLHKDGILACGLRTNLVPMPPKDNPK
jgi:hypothetical protein